MSLDVKKRELDKMYYVWCLVVLPSVKVGRIDDLFEAITQTEDVNEEDNLL